MDLTNLPFVSIHERPGLPNDSVVYFVTGPDLVPLYIGESVRLKNRWEAHVKRNAALTLGADRIIWYLVDDQERIALERHLISHYQPILNKAGTFRDPRRRPRKSPPS